MSILHDKLVRLYHLKREHQYSILNKRHVRPISLPRCTRVLDILTVLNFINFALISGELYIQST